MICIGYTPKSDNLFQLRSEQRIENALAIIDDKGHITLGEYAKVNNLSRTTASKELAKISSDPPICPSTTLVRHLTRYG